MSPSTQARVAGTSRSRPGRRSRGSADRRAGSRSVPEDRRAAVWASCGTSSWSALPDDLVERPVEQTGEGRVAADDPVAVAGEADGVADQIERGGPLARRGPDLALRPAGPQERAHGREQLVRVHRDASGSRRRRRRALRPWPPGVVKLAEMWSTGTSRVARLPLSRRHTSKPLRSGRRMSSVISSGTSPRRAAAPSRPVAASQHAKPGLGQDPGRRSSARRRCRPPPGSRSTGSGMLDPPRSRGRPGSDRRRLGVPGRDGHAERGPHAGRAREGQ